MFSSLIGALQGPASPKDEESSDGEKRDKNEAPGGTMADASTSGESAESPESSEQAASSGFDIWNLAGSVAETLKKQTNDIVSSVKDTDWKSELTAFGVGVEKEAENLEHTAEEAVKQLPKQLEARKETLQAGGGLGQLTEKLSMIGQTLVSGSTEIFEGIVHTVERELQEAQADYQAGGPGARAAAAARHATKNAGKYSRLEAEISAMQRDSSTYCEEPEDEDAYNAWLETFDLSSRQADIDKLTAENAFMGELQARIVPVIVEHDLFWSRYFYNLHRLQESHAQRVQVTELASKLKAEDSEELLGWDDDDAEDDSSRPSTPAAEPRASPQAAAGDSTAEEQQREATKAAATVSDAGAGEDTAPKDPAAAIPVAPEASAGDDPDGADADAADAAPEDGEDEEDGAAGVGPGAAAEVKPKAAPTDRDGATTEGRAASEPHAPVASDSSSEWSMVQESNAKATSPKSADQKPPLEGTVEDVEDVEPQAAPADGDDADGDEWGFSDEDGEGSDGAGAGGAGSAAEGDEDDDDIDEDWGDM